jgi:glycosyltransferase involved in cell wall biosynthesis
VDNGLESSRNFGIQNSQGDYILLLDADDKISSIYIEKAIYHLENNPSTKLVYGEAEYFGAMHGKWELPDYDYNLLLYRNHIYCSCIYRKTDYINVGGYNENIKYGFGDWDFLLKMLNRNDVVYKIPEVCFYYRRHSESLVTKYGDVESSMFQVYNQIYYNHYNLYIDKYNPIILLRERKELDEKINDLENKYYTIRKNIIIRLILKINSLFNI